MTTLHINNIAHLTTSDKKPMVYVSGDITHSNFPLGVQPSSLTYIEENNTYQQGQSVTLPADAMPTYLLQIQEKDPWELYGSDHNSGFLWFGYSDKMNEIHETIKNTYLNHVGTLPFSALTDDSFPISGSPVIRWNFNDGTSLIMAYVDRDCNQMYTLDQIQAKDIIFYEFGASIDDRLAHEFLQPYVARLLKKIKTPGTEIDIEDLGDEGDYEIDVNGKLITSKHNELLINLAEHLYCSILNLHETGNNSADYEPDEYAEAFAKKLYKNRLINELEKPTSDTSIRLTYIYETSNKEYNISFKEENNNWIVTTAYGSIGKKMKEDTQISTANIEEAQEVYLALLKDKLARGYDLDKNPQLNITKVKP
jgi:hypothetical protein